MPLNSFTSASQSVRSLFPSADCARCSCLSLRRFLAIRFRFVFSDRVASTRSFTKSKTHCIALYSPKETSIYHFLRFQPKKAFWTYSGGIGSAAHFHCMRFWLFDIIIIMDASYLFVVWGKRPSFSSRHNCTPRMWIAHITYGNSSEVARANCIVLLGLNWLPYCFVLYC